jgi:hypothetical protein
MPTQVLEAPIDFEGLAQIPALKELQPDPLAPLNRVLQTWFYKPDLQAIRIALGAVMAHYLRIGDPAWLFLVAPPGAGKTTMSLMGACGLPQVLPIGDISENTFLSGFYGHRDAGLLEKLGPSLQDGHTFTTQGDAILLAKDFTTVLSMRRDKRGVILSQLREIHDGMFKRDFGTGETKIWQGRITVLAAVTPVLDRYYSVFSTLGERFLQVRWHRPDSEEAGDWAIQQQEHEPEIREQSREAITPIFQQLPAVAPALPKEMRQRLAALAEVVAVGRTHVFRNGFGNREIEYVPEPEANTRVSKGLAALARGIAALHGRAEVAEQDLQDSFRVGLDCLPERRRRIILAAVSREELNAIDIVRTVREREVEDLAALGILAPPGQAPTGFTGAPGRSLGLSDRMAQLFVKASLEAR